MLSKKTKRALRKRALITFTSLLLLNGGVAHILINQIVRINNPEGSVLVKDSKISAQGADSLEDGVEIVPINDEKPTITTYIVKQGDTISGIADEFNVSVNTIRWANNLDAKGTIAVGDELTILPVTGIQYKIKSGDTVSRIAKRFGADADEIDHFNALEDGKLKVGETIIIPDAEPIIVPKKEESKKTTSTPKKVAVKAAPKLASETVVSTKEDDEKEEKTTIKTSSKGYFSHPIPNSTLTQGLHGYNSVDFGAPIGTPVHAAASGKVIVIKGGSAWNGGYGNYIVIEHDNGTQTLYAHLSSIGVSVGESVSKGEQIGKSGNTGKSTGPHLHFEVRNGTNPWIGTPKGTDF